MLVTKKKRMQRELRLGLLIQFETARQIVNNVAMNLEREEFNHTQYAALRHAGDMIFQMFTGDTFDFFAVQEAVDEYMDAASQFMLVTIRQP